MFYFWNMGSQYGKLGTSAVKSSSVGCAGVSQHTEPIIGSMSTHKMLQQHTHHSDARSSPVPV